MSSKSKTFKVTIFATLYFIIYAALYAIGANTMVLFAMLVGAPVVIIYLIYVVISDVKNEPPPMDEKQEFGYQDFPEAGKQEKKK